MEKKKPDRPIDAERRQKLRIDYRRNIRRQTEQARHNMRLGMFVVVFAVILFSIRITVMLFQISIKEHKQYSEIAARTHTEQYPVFSTRGNIYDANGKDLAISTYTYTIGVSPEVFGPRRGSEVSQEAAEEAICKILDLNVYEFREKLLANSKATYLMIKKNVDAETNEKLQTYLKEANIGGVAQDPNQSRYYPQGDLASPIIGFANKQDQALTGVVGIEAYYNAELAGQPGYVYRQVDNYWAQPLPNTSQANIPPTPGKNIQLTLQSDLQRLVQDLAIQVSDATKPLNGSQIIVMDPQTGAILAMSDETPFNLNNPWEAPHGFDSKTWNPSENSAQTDIMSGQVWMNRTLNYPFEIGSIMKPFVLSMGLDEAQLTKDTPLNDDFVMLKGWPYPISSYDRRSRGMLSPAESIWDSRNPPFVRIAQGLGLDTFYQYINVLGFRDKTGVDLPNEQTGLIHTGDQMDEISMAVTAFGEQVTITGMQIANDYCMLGNGGTLLRPRIAKAILDNNGQVVQEMKPQVIRRVFSEETTRTVRDMMIGVGRYGTARKAYYPGLEVGYKTGTSSRAINGSDTDNSFTHSAVALVPAQNPKYLVICVTHDNEQPFSKASQVVVRQIINYLANRDRMPVHYKAYDYNFLFRNYYPADVKGDSMETAQQTLYDLGLSAVLAPGLKSGQTVQSQYPVAGMNSGYNGRIWLSDQANALPEEKVILPNFVGLTAEEALREADRLHLNIAMDGSDRAGKVTSQKVLYSDLAGGKEPGEFVRYYSQVILNFDGTDHPAPAEDDSLTKGYDNGAGKIYY